MAKSQARKTTDRVLKMPARKRKASAESVEVSHEEIARVAFELYMKRGGGHGHDRDDWFEAEDALRRRAAGVAVA